jgi:hypothetical protein
MAQVVVRVRFILVIWFGDKICFLETMEQALAEYRTCKRRDILNEMGAQTIGRELWESISDSQPPKQLVPGF